MESRARRPVGSGTAKLVQKAPKPAPGNLTDPLDATVAGDKRDGLGRGRGLPSLKPIQVCAELPAKIAPWMLFRWDKAA